MKAKEQAIYNKLQKTCNDLLLSRVGMGWDDLADTNSCWDYLDENMTDKQITKTAPDICWDRLYDSGMDRDMCTELMYGNNQNKGQE